MSVVKVGVGVLIFKGDDILLGKRKGSHGEGQWGFPGGSLEHGEGFAEAALREIAEEVGPDFEVKELDVISVINLLDYMPKHYIDIGLTAEWVSGDPVNMEPDKCEEWGWFNYLEPLPEPRFSTVDRIIDAYLLRGPSVIDGVK